MAVGALAGVVLFFLLKLLSRNAAEATIVSLGFAILIEEILRMSVRTSYFLLVDVEWGHITFAGEKVSTFYVLASTISLTFTALLLIVYRSRIGLALKTIEDDAELAEIYGADVDVVRLITIAATSAIVALSGCVLSPTHALSPLMGFPVLVSGIIIASFATLLGGFGERLYGLCVLVAVAYSYALSVIP